MQYYRTCQNIRINACVISSPNVPRIIYAMGLDDAWTTNLKLMALNVNALMIAMGNIVNTKNIVSIINPLI